MLAMQTNNHIPSSSMKPLEDYFDQKNTVGHQKGSIDMGSIKNSFSYGVGNTNSYNQVGIIPAGPIYEGANVNSNRIPSISSISSNQTFFSIPVSTLPLQHSVYISGNPTQSSTTMNTVGNEFYNPNNNNVSQYLQTVNSNGIPNISNTPAPQIPSSTGIIVNLDNNMRPMMFALSPKERGNSITLATGIPSNNLVTINNNNNNPGIPTTQMNYTLYGNPSEYNTIVPGSNSYFLRNSSIVLLGSNNNNNINNDNKLHENPNSHPILPSINNINSPSNPLIDNNNYPNVIVNRKQSHPNITRSVSPGGSTPLPRIVSSSSPSGVVFSPKTSHTGSTEVLHFKKELNSRNSSIVSDATTNVAGTPSKPNTLMNNHSKSPSQNTTNTPTIASLLVNDKPDTKCLNKEEKIYKCDLCDKSFLRGAWLRRHVLTHTSYRQYKCVWCKSKHKRRDNLFKHIKIKHMDYLMDAIQNFYPLAHFESRDLKTLLATGQLHREDVKKVILSVINNDHQH